MACIRLLFFIIEADLVLLSKCHKAARCVGDVGAESIGSLKGALQGYSRRHALRRADAVDRARARQLWSRHVQSEIVERVQAVEDERCSHVATRISQWLASKDLLNEESDHAKNRRRQQRLTLSR